MDFLSLLIRVVSTSFTLLGKARDMFSGFYNYRGRPQYLALPHPSYYEPKGIRPMQKQFTPYEQIQITTEKLFHKNQLMPRIKGEFKAASTDFKGMMAKHSIPEEFGFTLLAQMALHRRADITTLVGILRNQLENRSIQDTADLIVKCAEAELVDYVRSLDLFVVKPNYILDDATQHEIDAYQFPMPLVVKPRQLKCNTDTGYHHNTKGSVILRDNHHDDDVYLNHLNRMNSIGFSINTDVTNKVKNIWKSLDKQKESETRKEFMARKNSFLKYNATCADVFAHIFAAGNNTCYLTHKYDKRGRTYCVGYHVNPQGNAWNKAVIEFADKEII